MSHNARQAHKQLKKEAFARAYRLPSTDQHLDRNGFVFIGSAISAVIYHFGLGIFGNYILDIPDAITYIQVR